MIDARISVALPSHPKTKKLIKIAGTDAAWRLVCLFLWVAQNRPDGVISGMDAEDIELAAGWDGEAGVFIAALRRSGYVQGDVGFESLDTGMCLPGKPMIARFGRVCSKTWNRIRSAIFARDGFVCAYCGDVDGPFECDHVVPISRGGSNEKSNLVTACRKCNRSKRSKLVDEWRGG